MSESGSSSAPPAPPADSPEAPAPPPASRGLVASLGLPAIVALALGVLLAILLATDVWPGLRGPDNWRWGRRPVESIGGLFFVVVIFAAQVVVVGRLRQVWGGGRGRGPALASLVVLTFLQFGALTAAEPGGLSNVARRVLDPAFTSYHTIAIRQVDDVGDFLERYPRISDRFPVHGPSQPPGRVLFFHAINELVTATGSGPALLAFAESAGMPVPRGMPGTTDDERAGAFLAGFLLFGIAALTVVPLVVIAGGSCRPGGVAASLLFWVTVPSFALFAPQTDHLLLLLTATAAALGLEALRYAGQPRSLPLALAAGAVAGGALFFSFTVLAALGAWGLMLLGYFFLRARQGSGIPVARGASILGAALAGFLVLPAVIAAAGLDWFAVFRKCVEAAHRVQVHIHGREFSTWLVWNLVDFALFLSWPLVALAFVQARREVTAFARPASLAPATPCARDSEEPHHDAPAAPELPFALALFGALLVLDLSGRILGETGRIWMFLMPLAALAAGAHYSGRSYRTVVVVALAQFLVLLAMRGFLNVPG